MKRRFALLSFPLIATLLVFISGDLFEKARWPYFDWLQRTLTIEKTENVAVVTVDQYSLDYLEKSDGLVYPWPREVYAVIVLMADHHKAKAVAFDYLFTETSHAGVDDDKAFASIISDAKTPVFFPDSDPHLTIKRPVKEIRDAADGFGAVHLPRDSDLNLRRVPSLLPGPDDKQLPSLAESIFRSLTLSQKDKEHPPLIRFYPVESVPTISIAELLRGYRLLSENKPLPESLTPLKNRVWFIGVTAPGLHDFKPTPLGDKVSGVYLHAMGLENRMGQQHLKEKKEYVYLFSLIVAFLSTSLVFVFSSPIFSVLVSLLFSVSIPYFLSYILFSQQFWLSPLDIALTGLLASVLTFSYRFFFEWRERLQLSKSLENSMSSEMLQLIRQGKVQISRFGERRPIIILFSDLAGFTTLSEQLPPERLVQILNSYFDEVVHLILQNKGYVDKFIGDAVMAIWGAPIPNKDDVKNALQVAVSFKDSVAQVNALVAKEFPDIQTQLSARVGLHAGPAIVGNIGSEKRHNYTAIGDAVNLSARLESLCKQYSLECLVSGEVLELAQSTSHPDWLLIDQVGVKGKTQPTDIYSHFSGLPQEQKANYQKAFQLYQEKSWSQAISYWQQSLSIPSSSTMIQRCEKLLDHPDLNSFQEGVWYHDSK